MNLYFFLDILSCASSPCIRGQCTNVNNGYTCKCPQGYTGTNCESGKLRLNAIMVKFTCELIKWV